MSDFKTHIKIYFIILSIFIVVSAIVLCFIKPKMHKPFQMNIIEYIMKINSDGTTTTTKQVTTTTLKGN